MSPIGLQNEATIKLKVELDSTGIDGVKTLLRQLTAAMNAQSFAQQTRVMKQSIVMLRQELAKTKVDLRNAEKAITSMKNATAQAATGVKKLGSTQRDLKGLLDRLSQAETKFDALFRAAYRLQMVGRNLQNFSRMIVDLGQNVMNTFGDFEFMMNRAAGAMQIWQDKSFGTVDATVALRNGILDTAEALKLFPAEQIAQGLYFWGSATGQVVETQDDLNVALSALIPIMQTAAMTNTGYEQTIKGVYSIITQYYNGALEKAGDVTKTLFYVTQKTAAEFTDLIQSFKMVGPVAAQIGVTFEQTAEIFGKMADLGMRGSMTGRAFRQLYIQLLKPSTLALAKYGQVFNELGGIFEGKSFYEMIFPEGKYAGIEKHIEVLGTAMANLDQQAGLEFLSRISTANMLPMVVALTAQWRLEQTGLAKSTDKLANAETEAITYFNKNWEMLAGSWNATVESLNRSVERLKITVGAELAKVLTPVIERFREFLSEIQKIVDENPKLVQSIGRIVSIIAGIAAVAGQALVVTGALIGLTSAIGVVIMGFGTLTGAIGAVIAFAIALGEAIVRNFEYIQFILAPAVQGVIDAFDEWQSSATGLYSTIDNLSAMIQEFANTAIRGIVDLVDAILDGISVFMELDAEMNGALSAALLIFVASLTVAKIATAALGVVLNSKLITSLRASIVAFRTAAVSSTAMTVSIRGLGAALWSLMGGPFGLIALGAMLMMTGFRVPVLSDFIDSITAGFRDFNKELGETVNLFGDIGTFKFEGMFKNSASVIAEFPSIENTAIEMWDEGLMRQGAEASIATYRENVLKYGELIQPSLDKANAEAVDALAIDLAANRSGEQGKLHAAIANAMAQEWIVDSGELNAALVQAGRETISTADFGKAANEMMGYQDIDFFVDKAKSDELGDFVAKLIQNTPLFISNAEIGSVYEQVKEAIGPGWEDFWAAFDPSEFAQFNIAKIGNTYAADFEDVALPALEAIANQIWASPGMSAADIAKLITDPVYNGLSAEEILQDSRIQGLPRELAQAAHSAWEQAFARESGTEYGFTLAETVKFLKDTWTVIIDHAVVSSFPDITEWTEAIGNLSFITDRNEMRDAFIAIIESGLGDALMSADLPDEFKQAVLPYLEDAMRLRDTPELRALMATLKEDGIEVGEKASREWIGGLAEGVNANFTKKELRDAIKLGRGRDAVRETLQKYGSDLFNKAAKGGLFARELVRDAAKEDKANITSWLENRFTKGPRAGQKSLNAVQGVLKRQWADYSSLGRKLWKGWIRSQHEQGRKVDLDFFLPGVKRAEQRARQRRKLMEKVAERYRTGPKGSVSVPTSPAIVPAVATAIQNIPSSPEVVTGTTKAGSSIATSLVTETAVALKTADYAAVIENISSGIALADRASIVSAGIAIGDSILDGIKSFNNEGNVATLSPSISGLVGKASTSAMSSIGGSAAAVGSAWVKGFGKGVSSASINISGAFTVLKEQVESNSPPRKGTLKNLDKWGQSAGETWVENVKKGINNNSRRLFSGSEGMMRGEVAHNSKMEITVKLEVTSPDGSVNRQRQSDVRKGAQKAMSMAGIEHYATIGSNRA
jgi:TP901 family phage tail tape measure protein